MKFLSIREFTAFPKKTQETLKYDGKVVLTNNGKPSMLVFDIAGQDFEGIVDTLNRVETMRLLEGVQMQAVRGGLNTMTQDEINSEITAYRRNIQAGPAAPSGKKTYTKDNETPRRKRKAKGCV